MDFKMPVRQEFSHKGSYGRVLNIAGSDYMPGAALLSSLASLKIGCGYVFLCTTERVIDAVAAQTQNIVFAPVSDLETQLKNADVLSIGCGLSTHQAAVSLFIKTMELAPDVPTVIDADGLNILSKLESIFLPSHLILTPHPKEAARLLHVDLDVVLADMEKAAKEISNKYNCVTVLKSHNTIVCSKDLEIYVNNTGNSALAKAGSGDVLTGMIAGLLAQKCEAFYAARLGVYLHGLCGDLAKNDLTEYGVFAHDLIRYIPGSIKTLL